MMTSPMPDIPSAVPPGLSSKNLGIQTCEDNSKMMGPRASLDSRALYWLKTLFAVKFRNCFITMIYN